jgi:hypothetical protein
VRILSLAVAAGFLAGAPLGATPAGAQEQLGIAQTLTGELARRGAIAWEPARHLVWADFRASPPEGTGREAALTASGFLYALHCDRKHLEYGVLTLFQPDASWVEPIVLTDSTQSHVLPHEQGHFNISELGARLLRADLLEFNLPCAASDSAFARIAQSGFVRERAMQARYDEETLHGTLPAEQAGWMSRVATALDSLSFVSVPYVSRKY